MAGRLVIPYNASSDPSPGVIISQRPRRTRRRRVVKGKEDRRGRLLGRVHDKRRRGRQVSAGVDRESSRRNGEL